MNQQMNVCPICGTLTPENSPNCSKCNFVFSTGRIPERNIPPSVPVQNIYNNVSYRHDSKTDRIQSLFPIIISILTFIMIIAIYKLPIAKLCDNHTFNSSDYGYKPFSANIATLYFGEKTELYKNIYYISSSGSRESVKNGIVENYRDSIEGAETPLTFTLIIVMMLAIFTSVFAVTKHSLLSFVFSVLNSIAVFFMLIPPDMPFCKNYSTQTYNFSLIPDAGGVLIIILVYVIAGFAVTNFVMKTVMKHRRS